jgi:hypothetical protein
MREAGLWRPRPGSGRRGHPRRFPGLPPLRQIVGVAAQDRSGPLQSNDFHTLLSAVPEGKMCNGKSPRELSNGFDHPLLRQFFCFSPPGVAARCRRRMSGPTLTAVRLHEHGSLAGRNRQVPASQVARDSSLASDGGQRSILSRQGAAGAFHGARRWRRRQRPLVPRCLCLRGCGRSIRRTRVAWRHRRRPLPWRVAGAHRHRCCRWRASGWHHLVKVENPHGYSAPLRFVSTATRAEGSAFRCCSGSPRLAALAFTSVVRHHAARRARGNR